MFKNFHFLMNEAEAGGGGGGTETLDRGDELNPKPAPASPAASAQAEEDLKKIIPEGEPAPEGEPEPEPQPRDEDGKFAKKGEARIPKARFDEAVNKEREAREAAERRAAEAEARLAAAAQNEDVQKLESKVEELEAQHAQHVLDGDKEKAAAVMKEIRHTERKIVRLENERTTQQATSQAVENIRFETAVSALEAAYPEFNPDSEQFNQSLVNLALAEQARLMREDRLSPAAALTKAGNSIMELFVKKNAPAAEAPKGLAAAKAVEDDRKAKQVAKNLDTDKRQPPSMKDSGLDSNKLGGKAEDNVSNMTAEEWAALPEATRAKLRGDVL